MRHSAFLLTLFFLLSFLVLLVGQVVAQDPRPTYAPSECPFEGGDDIEGVEYGSLLVPENRDDPNGRTLRLAVAVVRSLSDAPAPDPLVFLDGGPGAPSVIFTPQRLKESERSGRGVDYGRALWEARQAVRGEETWSDPYYWASFVLMGKQ